MKLFLVRHGEKEGHGFEAPLTELGKSQIKNLSLKISKLSIDEILSSSNPRSIESAKIISEKLSKDFEIIKNLKEFEKDMFYKDTREFNSEEKEDYSNLITLINKIERNNQNTLLIMNAGINRAIICSLLKYPLNRAITLTQDFASLTELELKEIHGEKIWCLNSINEK